jgi:hypothetical protein
MGSFAVRLSETAHNVEPSSGALGGVDLPCLVIRDSKGWQTQWYSHAIDAATEV